MGLVRSYLQGKNNEKMKEMIKIHLTFYMINQKISSAGGSSSNTYLLIDNRARKKVYSD